MSIAGTGSRNFHNQSGNHRRSSNYSIRTIPIIPFISIVELPTKGGKGAGYVNRAAGAIIPGTTRERHSPDLIVRAALIRIRPGCRRLRALHQNGRLLITALDWDTGQTGSVELNRDRIWIRVGGWVGNRVRGN